MPKLSRILYSRGGPWEKKLPLILTPSALFELLRRGLRLFRPPAYLPCITFVRRQIPASGHDLLVSRGVQGRRNQESPAGMQLKFPFTVYHPV